jgi:hypothetical protein
MAIDLVQMEQRLAAVEAALVEIQQKLGLVSSPANWVERMAGSLADLPEEDYQRFLECCRNVRNGDPVSVSEELRP